MSAEKLGKIPEKGTRPKRKKHPPWKCREHNALKSTRETRETKGGWKRRSHSLHGGGTSRLKALSKTDFGKKKKQARGGGGCGGVGGF